MAEIFKSDEEYIFKAEFIEDYGLRFMPTGESIVRCKDCKHRSYWHTDTDDTPKWERCELFDHPTKGDDFCSRGERKGEKE